MSEGRPEGAQGGEGSQEAEAGVELAPQGNAAFSALMDMLAPEEGGEAGSGAGETDKPAGGEAGAGAEAGAGDAGKGDDAAKPAAGEAGKPAAGDTGGGDEAKPGADGAAAGDAGAADAERGGTDQLPADWTAEATDLQPRFGQLSTALEERAEEAYRAEALGEVRKEHAKYFEMLDKHPRLIVGAEVPDLTSEDGMTVLKDAADAKDWQEAAATVLAQEVQTRASKGMEESQTFLDTVHSSIELFQNNVDLIPGTKGFDVDLANRFADLAQPYELRDSDQHLIGYSIPVQPLIDRSRAALKKERADKPAAPAPSKAGAAAPKPEDPPQAGVQSKAGSGDEGENFDTLFGTLGLKGFRI